MSNIKIEPLTRLDQIRVGDGLIVDGGGKVIVCVAKEILVSECGVEVVFKRKANKFFNVKMYLDGHSWAEDVRVVTANYAVGNFKTERTTK